jgi:hypothetical protein
MYAELLEMMLHECYTKRPLLAGSPASIRHIAYRSRQMAGGTSSVVSKQGDHLAWRTCPSRASLNASKTVCESSYEKVDTR